MLTLYLRLNYFGNISRTENINLALWHKIKEYVKELCVAFSKSKNKKLYGELKDLKKQYIH